VFLLFKLILLPLYLPLKILAELVEHAGHRRRYRRRLRVNWLPGRTGLSRWTSDVYRSLGTAGRTPVQRFLVGPLAVLAVFLVWAGLVYAWMLWWLVLVIAVPLMAVA
jgi:hypothetical protein